MKKLLTICFLMMVCYPLTAQNKLFVRVYDLKGHKIEKGYVLEANDTILRLAKDNISFDIPVKTIGTVKTKRSVGHNILVGSLIGTAIVGSLGAASAEPDAEIMGYSAGEGFILGTIVGAPSGALIGLFSAALKNSKEFTIKGDLEKWKIFQNYLSERSN